MSLKGEQFMLGQPYRNSAMTPCSGRDYWLKVSGLMEQMETIGRSGQAALVKIDGLRESGKIYTVILDGPDNAEPMFRRNSGDLLAALKDAVSAGGELGGPLLPRSWPLNEVATLLAEADASARSGVFVAVRMDAARKEPMYEVSMGGPLMGGAYFDKSGVELASLLLEAMAFYAEHAVSR